MDDVSNARFITEKQHMSKWEENVRRVTPYTPGEQPKRTDIIKLNTNENPYPPSEKVRQCLASLDTALLRRYPSVTCEGLNGALAQRYGLKREQVFSGVGSDDVLAMCFLTFFNGKEPILFPDITYSFYIVWAQLFGIPYETVPLDDDLHICPDDYRRPNGGIIFPNPNAPTGELLALEAVEQIVAENPQAVVIVDEAYIDFGGESAVPLIDKYENLLVVGTFSKSRALAGLRIGFALGNEKLIRCLEDVKYSFNSYTMNTPALLAGEAVLKDEAYNRQIIGKIIKTRERMKEVLRSMGFVMGDSKANFLFVTHPEYSAAELFAALKKEGIYVRYFNLPRIDRYLRITIGTDREMDVFTDVLRRCMSK